MSSVFERRYIKMEMEVLEFR